MSWLIIDEQQVSHYVNLESLTGLSIAKDVRGRNIIIIYSEGSPRVEYSVPKDLDMDGGRLLTRMIIDHAILSDKNSVYHMSTLIETCIERIKKERAHEID